MKIIVRKADNVVIYGTNNNDTTIEVIDNNLVIDGQITATDVSESNFELVLEPAINLINPFFVGYVAWIGAFVYTEQYQLFNVKTHNCLQEVRGIYYLKSQDPQYTEEERQSFVDYYTLLDDTINIAYLDPTFSYPVPPDEIFPYYPPCSNN
jgi:hypothetical protein